MAAVAMASTLADRVQLAIDTSGLSQNEIERQMGKSRGYLSTLLRRKGQPRADSFTDFARVTRVRVSWLIDGELPMRVTDAEETDSPELVAFLGSPAAANLSEATVAGVRAFATKSTSRLTEADIVGLARVLEGQHRMITQVVHDDPIEAARAAAKKKGGTHEKSSRVASGRGMRR